jgi:hypothetical protein
MDNGSMHFRKVAADPRRRNKHGKQVKRQEGRAEGQQLSL